MAIRPGRPSHCGHGSFHRHTPLPPVPAARRRRRTAEHCPSCGLVQTGEQVGRLRAIVARLEAIARAQYALTAEATALRAEHAELLRALGTGAGAPARRGGGRRPSPAPRSCVTSSCGSVPPSSPWPP